MTTLKVTKDTVGCRNTRIKKAVKEKQATYLLEFETPELRNEFKAYCVANGTDMKTMLNDLIKSVLEKGN